MKAAFGGAATMNTASAERDRSSKEAGAASDRAFLAVSALTLAVSATVTFLGSESMSAMGGMPMPGGWVMSMMWMRVAGETWLETLGSFLAMWTVMMAAMMLPVLLPMLWRYRKAIRNAGVPRSGVLTAVTGLSYFVVWSAVGLAVFPLGVAMAEITMRDQGLSRAIPVLSGAVVLVSGMLQFSSWKSHCLARCRKTPVPTDAAGAIGDGLRLGVVCIRCCANLMAIFFALGLMDFGVMVAVAAAITIERVAPESERIRRLIGIITIGAGLILIAIALGYPTLADQDEGPFGLRAIVP
jgi:predicted metal-binding membrane protein